MAVNFIDFYYENNFKVLKTQKTQQGDTFGVLAGEGVMEGGKTLILPRSRNRT